MPQKSAPRISPKPMFPVMSSLAAAVSLAKSQLPIETPNQLMTVLNTYHNTLLQEVARSPN